MGNEKTQTRGFEKALETATQNKKSPMNLSQERMRAIGAGAEAQLTQAQKRRPSLFSGMFASRVSFQVHGTQLEGKDGQELSQAGVVPLFAGAALDLSASSLIGNKRNGMVWAEGHHARLALSPEGTNAAELLHVEDIWIGLKNERDPSSASVIFSTNQPVSLGDDRYSLKAQMLFMTEEEETIKLVGAEVRNQEGDIVASSGLARITADGVLDGDRQDLFQKAAQKEAEEQQQETQQEAQQSQEEQKTEELAEEVTEQPVPQSSNERAWKGIREDWRRSDENIRRRLQREEAGREAEKKAAEEAEKEEKAEKEKKRNPHKKRRTRKKRRRINPFLSRWKRSLTRRSSGSRRFSAAMSWGKLMRTLRTRRRRMGFSCRWQRSPFCCRLSMQTSPSLLRRSCPMVLSERSTWTASWKH